MLEKFCKYAVRLGCEAQKAEVLYMKTEANYRCASSAGSSVFCFFGQCSFSTYEGTPIVRTVSEVQVGNLGLEAANHYLWNCQIEEHATTGKEILCCTEEKDKKR